MTPATSSRWRRRAPRSSAARPAWPERGGSGSATVQLEAGAVVVAIGSVSRVPDLPGLAEARPWTNVEGTSTRRLPRSLAILGGGPTGVELAQVYARYDVPVTLIHPRNRVHDKEHPRSSELLGKALENEGVVLRLGARATRVRAGDGADGSHVIELGDDDPVEAPRDPARRRTRSSARRAGARDPSASTCRTAASRRTNAFESRRTCTWPATSPDPRCTPISATTPGRPPRASRWETTISALPRCHPARDLHRSRDRVGRPPARPGPGAWHRRRRVHRRHRHLRQGLHD